MRSRTSTDASVHGVTWRVHSWSGNGIAEPFGAGVAFPSGGTGTSLYMDMQSGADVLALRCLVGYLGPTVATAL